MDFFWLTLVGLASQSRNGQEVEAGREVEVAREVGN